MICTLLYHQKIQQQQQQQQIEHVTEYHYNFTSDYLPPNIMVLISNCKMAIKQHNFILLWFKAFLPPSSWSIPTETLWDRKK